MVNSLSIKATEKYATFLKAVKSHSLYQSEAANGKGIDRHLFGLRLVLQEGENHELFTDDIFLRSTRYLLSTSTLNDGKCYQGIGCMTVRAMLYRFAGTGFGAAYPDGYGINYCMGPQCIKMGIESKRSSRKGTSSDGLARAIRGAFLDVLQMCQDAQVAEAKM